MEGYIELKEFSYDDIVKSQSGTISRKNSYRHAKAANRYKKIINNRTYHNLAINPMFFNIHIQLKNRIEKFLLHISK